MMAACDICLLPFRSDAVSHAACPLKLFEYAALGKPIVSTPVREVERIAGVVTGRLNRIVQGTGKAEDGTRIARR